MDCVDVGPRPRTGWWIYGLAVGIGVLPIVWAFGMVFISRVLYRHWTMGPGDITFGATWNSAFGWTYSAYSLWLPMAMVTLAFILAKSAWRRGMGGLRLLALFLFGFLLGAVSWLVGLVGLQFKVWPL